MRKKLVLTDGRSGGRGISFLVPGFLGGSVRSSVDPSFATHLPRKTQTDDRGEKSNDPCQPPFLTILFPRFSVLVFMCTSVRAGGLDGQETLFHVFSCFSLSLSLFNWDEYDICTKSFHLSLVSFFLGKRARKETFHFSPLLFFPASRLFIEKLPPSSQQRPLKPWRAGEEEEKKLSVQHRNVEM